MPGCKERVPGLVSVIIPTFNREEMVVRAVESVLKQSYSHTQIIVVDDGSTDNTAHRLSTYPRVEFIRQPNLRQAAARNKGLLHARGEYIVSLDSDDNWSDNFLTGSINILKKTGANFAFSNWFPRNDPGRRIDEIRLDSAAFVQNLKYHAVDDWFLLNREDTRSLFIGHNPAPSSGVVYRRNPDDHFWNERAKIADDYIFLLETVLRHDASSVFTVEKLWYKDLHDSNICDNHADPRILAANEIHDSELILEMFDDVMSSEERAIVNRRTAVSYADWGYYESSLGHRGKALDCYRRALSHDFNHKHLFNSARALFRPAPASR